VEAQGELVDDRRENKPLHVAAGSSQLGAGDLTAAALLPPPNRRVIWVADGRHPLKYFA
jgi:hypothetical protein